ncbi:MAG: hypothetical protein COA79_22590 [Planctomycetota bacterium]|nr:MAG: hypothetical protein COA79_22590 [Planctomycetota bacterium]
MKNLFLLLSLTAISIYLFSEQQIKKIPTHNEYKKILNLTLSVNSETITLSFSEPSIFNISHDIHCFIAKSDGSKVSPHYSSKSGIGVSSKGSLSTKISALVKSYGAGEYYLIVSYKLVDDKGKAHLKGILRTEEFEVKK